jgi:DNA polymerase III delta prime subunit
MYWDHVIGHEDIKQVLRNALKHPAPGYVFFGPTGIGKTALAQGFARALLNHAPEKPLEAHPDFTWLMREASEKSVPVDDVRALVADMHLTPVMGRRRVALIHEADYLNVPSSNSLLKAVEEPKGNAVFLFTVASLHHVPATLRSRLVPLRMRPRQSDDLAAWLQTLGATKDEAERAAFLSAGCPGRAKRMLAEPERWSTRIELVEALLRACDEGPLGRRLEALENMKKTLDKEEDPLTAWKESLSLAMRLARQRINDPERFAEVGNGLSLAWHFVGSPVSPELGLEWTAVRSSFINEHRYTPSFLYPSYL